MTKQKAKLPNLDKYLEGRRRRLVTYAQGANLYRVPYYTFVRMSREARANFQVSKVAIVELDIFEVYLDEHPEAAERVQRLRRFE